MEQEPNPLETSKMFLSHDRLLMLEDEVWAEYEEQVERGFITIEAAEQGFVRWRNCYLDIGNNHCDYK